MAVFPPFTVAANEVAHAVVNKYERDCRNGENVFENS